MNIVYSSVTRLVRWILSRLYGIMPPTHSSPPISREHLGATVEWSPAREVAEVETGEPVETLQERADREVAEHAAARRSLAERQADELTAEWDAHLNPILGPLFAEVEWACQDALHRLGVTERDVDEYLTDLRAQKLINTAQHDFSELRRLVAAPRRVVSLP